MPDRDTQPDVPRGLPRLPPGRHGLAREYVTKNQRDRLTAGIIAAVAEHGYRPATVSQICAAAGLSRRTFYSYFASKEECYLAGLETFFGHLEEVIAAAGDEESAWGTRVRARIEVMLQIFAANPALARFSLIAPVHAGEAIGAQQRGALEKILGALTAGREEAQVKALSSVVEHALIGGLIGSITLAVEQGEGEQLQDLLPELAELFLGPYLGREAAIGVARS